MGTPRDRVSVLRPGMAPEFRPGPRDASLMERWGIAAEDQVAMFLGTMYEFSGLDVVIQGFDEVVRAVPQAKLLLVGGANEFERFKGLAGASPVADRIVFTGMQPIQGLPGLINLSALTFNSFRRTSLTDTVFPEKLPRYMACGKPVLATPLSAARELLVGEENGVVFRDLGPGFLEEMKRLLGDEERCARLGEAARSFVEKNYNWDRTIEELEAVFEEAIAEKRTRSARLSER
jgi:glycogen synthase